jgi:putative mRNA 3-end processing factor
MCAVELRKAGLHLSGTALWLDAKRKTELSFVSHAHADHVARHERVIATGATLALMADRLGKLNGALPVPYRRPFALGPLTVELLPAGHILGSAQIRVTRSDGRRVVYTGDLNLAPSMTAEPAEVAHCDTLVMESTFGHPRYVFPPKDEVLASIEKWIREKIARKVSPVLLGYPVGKSQEIIRHLTHRGLGVRAHASIHRVSKLYAACGVPVGEVLPLDGQRLGPDEVALFPPRLARGAALGRLWPYATAMLTGWALDPGAPQRYRADAAFPLSDHADFRGLVDYAKATGAREVLTCHGFARELAQSLRAEGIDARPVGTIQQLDLFGVGSTPTGR